MLHDWVSDFLFGPAISTTRHHKASFDYPDCMGLTDAHLDLVTELLEEWGLLRAPCIISEDGTALQMRVDITVKDKTILVFGLNGGSFCVTSVAEFLQTAEERSLATTLYAYTLVPLARGAPHIPLFAWCHNNSKLYFNGSLIQDVWRYLWQASAFLSLST